MLVGAKPPQPTKKLFRTVTVRIPATAQLRAGGCGDEQYCCVDGCRRFMYGWVDTMV